ncbi:MAG: hypothetical protein JWN17_505, partial [Frankiales bacterium]|nr:hypothetical protein [Frankiales bacterium]
PPTQRAAARQLRRTATPTTGRTWLRSRLPGRSVARAGVPLSEALTSLLVVALAFVPVVVWTQGAAGAFVALAASLVVLGHVLWARRVVVGTSWVAVRQLGRYHVATVDHVQHLELRPSQHGGVLCLHTDDGRCMRLRRVEVARPDVNAALRELAARHGGTRDSRAQELLGLPHDASRLRHRYLADALQ